MCVSATAATRWNAYILLLLLLLCPSSSYLCSDRRHFFFFFISFSIFYFPIISYLTTLAGETSSARARDAWPRLIPHCLHTHACDDGPGGRRRGAKNPAVCHCRHCQHCRRRYEQCEARCTFVAVHRLLLSLLYMYYIYSSFYYFIFFFLYRL